MKNLPAALLAIIVLSSSAYAQQVIPPKRISKEGIAEAYAGPSMKAKPGRTFKEFTLVSDNRHVIRMNANRDDEFEVFDNNLGVAETYTWDDARYNGGADMKLIAFNGNYYKLRTGVDRDKNTNSVFITQYELGKGPSTDSLELTTIKEEAFYYEYFNKAFAGAKVNRKGDVMIVTVKMPDQNNPSGVRSPKLRFMAFDQSFKMLWMQDLDFYDREGKIKEGADGWFAAAGNSNVLVSDNGDAYVWGEIDRGAELEDSERYKLKLFKLNKDGVKMTSTSKLRGLESKIVATQGHLVMVSTFGQYGLKQKSGFVLGGAEGLQLLRWNGDSDNPTVKELAFGIDHLSNNKTGKAVKNLQKMESKGTPLLSPNFTINDLILLEDNSLIVAAQNQNVEKEVATNGYTTYTHTGGDIHVFSLSDKDKINWSQQIPVNQINKDGLGIGYGLKVWNNTAYVFFNDHFENVAKEWTTEKSPSKWTGKDDHAVAYVAIDMANPDNEQKRNQYWKSRSAGVTMKPALFTSHFDQDYGLLFIEGGKQKLRLIRLEFD
ncbi:MAG: hypothetical protein ACI85F_001892 [Bacteroidia bacterium]|jgi:hypothetical protein